MSKSVSLHHDLIRSLIRQHRGYEVKTIGDSFMIAFADVTEAAHLAMELQTLFYKAKWPADIDATYAELLFEAELVDPQLALMSSEVSEEQKNILWRGVRVRVGIHYGHGDIRKDPVTLGYDYYGTVVNTAARVEGVGHGGQVLITEEAYCALEPDFIASHSIQVIDLGPQPLLGLDSAVRLRQLLPSQFSARRFPPLRLDVENITGGDAAISDPSASDATDEIIIPEHIAQKIVGQSNIGSQQQHDLETVLYGYHFLNIGLSAAPEKWRKETLRELCKAWNVELRGSSRNSHMSGMMNIAMKIGRATDVKVNRNTAQQKGIATSVTISTKRSRQMSNDGFVFSVPASPSAVVTQLVAFD